MPALGDLPVKFYETPMLGEHTVELLQKVLGDSNIEAAKMIDEIDRPRFDIAIVASIKTGQREEPT